MALKGKYSLVNFPNSFLELKYNCLVICVKAIFKILNQLRVVLTH